MSRSSLRESEQDFEPVYDEQKSETDNEEESQDTVPVLTHQEKLEALDLEMQGKIQELQILMDQGGLAGAAKMISQCLASTVKGKGTISVETSNNLRKKTLSKIRMKMIMQGFVKLNSQQG